MLRQQMLTEFPDAARLLARLEQDLVSGVWEQRYEDLMELESLDVGYRLVVAGK